MDFSVRAWLLRFAGAAIGWGAFLLWGWGGWWIFIGLVLIGWAIAKEK